MRADKDAVLDLIMDVPTSGRFFPGVDGIEPAGEDRYKWLLTERRTLNSSFRGEYVAQYTRSGDEVRWESVEGNMSVKGVWRVTGPDGAVRVHVRVTSSLDAPVPRILKKPASLFAELESKNGLDKQLAKIDGHLRR